MKVIIFKNISDMISLHLTPRLHRRPSVECYKECSIFRKAKGAREARKETLTLELNAS